MPKCKHKLTQLYTLRRQYRDVASTKAMFDASRTMARRRVYEYVERNKKMINLMFFGPISLLMRAWHAVSGTTMYVNVRKENFDIYRNAFRHSLPIVHMERYPSLYNCYLR